MITQPKVYVEIDKAFARLEYKGVFINAVPLDEIRTREGYYDRDVIFDLFLSNGVSVPVTAEITDEGTDFDGDVLQLVRPKQTSANPRHKAWYKIFRKRQV